MDTSIVSLYEMADSVYAGAVRNVEIMSKVAMVVSLARSHKCSDYLTTIEHENGFIEEYCEMCEALSKLDKILTGEEP